jgi:hypothetical protein
MEREEIMPVVIIIIFQKMFESKGSKNKKDFDLKRSALTNIFFEFDNRELEHIIKLLLGDINIVKIENLSLIEPEYENFNSEKFRFLRNLCEFNMIHPQKIISFLKIMKNIIGNVGQRLLHFLPALNEVLMELVKWSFDMGALVKGSVVEIKENLVKDVELAQDKKTLLRIGKLNKMIKNLALERVADLYANYYEFNLESTTEELLQITESRVNMLSKESISKLGSLLKIFLTWSECELYKYYFLKYPQILPRVLEVLHIDKVKPNVYNLVFQLIKNLELFEVDEEVLSKFFNTTTTNKNTVLAAQTQSEFVIKIDSLKACFGEDSMVVENPAPFVVIDHQRLSLIGCYILHRNIPVFLEGFQRFFENTIPGYKAKRQELTQDGVAKSQNLETTEKLAGAKDVKKLNPNV